MYNGEASVYSIPVAAIYSIQYTTIYSIQYTGVPGATGGRGWRPQRGGSARQLRRGGSRGRGWCRLEELVATILLAKIK